MLRVSDEEMGPPAAAWPRNVHGGLSARGRGEPKGRSLAGLPAARPARALPRRTRPPTPSPAIPASRRGLGAWRPPHRYPAVLGQGRRPGRRQGGRWTGDLLGPPRRSFGRTKAPWPVCYCRLNLGTANKAADHPRKLQLQKRALTGLVLSCRPTQELQQLLFPRSAPSPADSGIRAALVGTTLAHGCLQVEQCRPNAIRHGA